MQDKRPAILLTGFGPFPGVPRNVSAELVTALADVARARFPKKRVITHVLPTEWQTAPAELAQLYKLHRPFLALHFGVSKRANGYRIESKALNIQRALPDAAGELPQSATVIGAGPQVLSVSIPHTKIVDRLRFLGVPVEISEDAGSYLCNCILYHALTLASQRKARAKVGFIHIPTAFNGRHFDLDTAIRGGLEIIRVCLKLPALVTAPASTVAAR